MDGEYELMGTYGNFLFIRYSTTNTPPMIYLVNFKTTEKSTIEEFIDRSNLLVVLLDKTSFCSKHNQIDRSVADILPTISRETITLENGAEAHFMRSSELDPLQKHPMISIIHGGPINASP